MAEAASPPLAPEATLDGTLGLEYLAIGAAESRGRLPVEDRVRQPFGAVHGGVFAAVAESLASRATAESVAGDGMLALGMSNQTTFLRPVAAGSIESVARRRHRGRTTWVWDVEHSDGDGRLCALSRVTIAVRPLAERSG